MHYIGRFAPSPTGPLHFGSLVAAVASYLDARSRQGKWLLRMEDIDPPREQAGASENILQCLRAHGLHWDGEVLYQSKHEQAYRDALTLLEQQQLSYRCTCSRRQLLVQQEKTDLPIYNQHCRHLNNGPETFFAIRLNVDAALKQLSLKPTIGFKDSIQGMQQQNIQTDVGDFIIHRKDGLFAYQLAVVVDDIFQGVTHVVRGADLLSSTARQILLFKLLGGTVPTFCHVPLALNSQGQKLCKQHHAPALDSELASGNLLDALRFLQLSPPANLADASCEDILHWGASHWSLASLQRLQ